MKVLLLVLVAIGATLADNFLNSEPNHLLDPFDEIFYNAEYHGHVDDNSSITDGIYVAPLDPFRPSDSRILHLSYQANLKFFEKGGPIFINPYYGQSSTRSGLVYDLASELTAAIVTADTRFLVRNSLKNATFDKENYYSWDHLLSDIAYLVTKVRNDFDSPTSRVILFGKYMSGTLSVLARQRYPHLIDGAWSSSGWFKFSPVNTVHFNLTSQNVHRFGSSACANSLSVALREIVGLAQSRSHLRLTQLFNLCPDQKLADIYDLLAFYESVFKWVSFRVRSYEGVQKLCRAMNIGPDPLTSFIRYIDFVYHNRQQCRTIGYNSRLRTILSFTFGQQAICLETGSTFFVTTDDSGIFPNVLDKSHYANLCRDFLGEFLWSRLQHNINTFHTIHGGRSLVTSNTIFSISEADAYSDNEVDSVGNGEIVRYKWHEAGEDMRRLTTLDSVDLFEAKIKIVHALRRFAGKAE